MSDHLIFKNLSYDIILYILQQWYEVPIFVQNIYPSSIKYFSIENAFKRSDFYGYFKFDTRRFIYCIFQSIKFMGNENGIIFQNIRMIFPLQLRSICISLEDNWLKLSMAIANSIQILGSNSILRRIEWNIGKYEPIFPTKSISIILGTIISHKIDIRKIRLPLQSICPLGLPPRGVKNYYRPKNNFIKMISLIPKNSVVILHRSRASKYNDRKLLNYIKTFLSEERKKQIKYSEIIT